MRLYILSSLMAAVLFACSSFASRAVGFITEIVPMLFTPSPLDWRSMISQPRSIFQTRRMGLA